MFFGLLLLILTCLIIPAIGVFQTYSGLPFAASFSQYLGLVALLGMAYCYILATRIKIVEILFGGLDKSYIVHKWLGLGSLAIIFLHDQIDPEIKSLGSTWISHFAKNLGDYGFKGLQVLLLVTVITLVPYALWKFTHKFIGIIFILAVLHFIWIAKPFNLISPLGLYMLSFCIFGILAYFYTLSDSFAKLEKYNQLKGTQLYKVTGKEQIGDVVSVELAPIKKGITYHAGQFSFISFRHEKLKESHPFTISKAPSKDGSLRFSVKALGDYSQALPEYLELGMTAKVSKGYGFFGQNRELNNEIWIAAGIGITPFIAMAQALSENKKKKVVLFYCVKSELSAIYMDELVLLAMQKTQLSVHFCNSGNEDKITLSKIKESIDFDIKDGSISFCGPSAMRKMLQGWFKSEGVPTQQFHYDAFVIRSGIGFDAYLQRGIIFVLNKFPKIKVFLSKYYWNK